MLPFAIVAPLIGPFLDRFAHGRRWAIGATMAMRAFLCWVLASSVGDGSALVFAAALGVLVSSKAYGVTRAAAVPRLLPRGFTLVKANGRVSLSGIVGATGLGPDRGARVAGGLRVVAALRVRAVRDRDDLRDPAARRGRLERGRGCAAGCAARAAARRAAAGCRPGSRARWRSPCAPTSGPWFLTGFLLMFVAFLLRDKGVGPDTFSPEVMIGIVVGAAGLGRHPRHPGGRPRSSRIYPGRRRRRRARSPTPPRPWWPPCSTASGRWRCSDSSPASRRRSRSSRSTRPSSATCPRRVQASAFGRSDTTCQLAWVIGGFVGIALPLDPPRLGLLVAFVMLVAWSRVRDLQPSAAAPGAGLRPGRKPGTARHRTPDSLGGCCGRAGPRRSPISTRERGQGRAHWQGEVVRRREGLRVPVPGGRARRLRALRRSSRGGDGPEDRHPRRVRHRPGPPRRPGAPGEGARRARVGQPQHLRRASARRPTRWSRSSRT